MEVFKLRDRLIEDYSSFVQSFITLRDPRIRETVESELGAGLLWPNPLIQMNPSFEPGRTIEELVNAGVLHEECRRIFRRDKASHPEGRPLRLHRHQEEAILVSRTGENYVLTTGTGSGKSLAYIIPIVDHVLRAGSGRGIQAVVVYPMNALANSQERELQKFLCKGYPDGKGPVTFARYTGQEKDEEKNRIVETPPDILLTNYVMLELILTRPREQGLIRSGKGLRFLVLDELHTYSGRQGADVGMLVRRARDAFDATKLQCVGTSATLASEGTFEEQRRDVAGVASTIFGAEVKPEHVIGETVRRTTPNRDDSDGAFVAQLKDRLLDESYHPPRDFQGFINDPLSIWIESFFGVEKEEGTGRLKRARPKSILASQSGESGAAHALSNLTGIPVDRCGKAIQDQLMASYGSEPEPDTGFPVFAFRLHQFIRRGDTVYASIEAAPHRHLTVHGQQFKPGDRDSILYPLAFCRECGQEYYCVRRHAGQDGGVQFSARNFSDPMKDEEGEPGYLYVSAEEPWPY